MRQKNENILLKVFMLKKQIFRILTSQFEAAKFNGKIYLIDNLVIFIAQKAYLSLF